MRRRYALTSLLVVLACAAVHARAAERRASRAEEGRPVRTLPVTDESLTESELQLRRAIDARLAGDPQGVIDCLEGVDFAKPSFPEADRAAYLLAHAYLELGGRDRFAVLARAVSGWSKGSGYTRWIAERQTFLEGGDPRLASLLAPLAAAPGKEAPLGKEAASAAGPASSALANDVAGAAALRRSLAMLARGEDPRPALESVPAASRYAARARHLAATIDMERGEQARAEAALARLAADSTYAGRREAALANAALALDRADWDRAEGLYQALDTDWRRHRDALTRTLSAGDYDPLWAWWESNASANDVLLVDGALRGLAEGARSLEPAAGAGPPLVEAAAFVPAPRWPVEPPSAEDLERVQVSAARLREARFALGRARHAVEVERSTLDRSRRSLLGARDRARSVEEAFTVTSARLDSLRTRLDAIDGDLRAIRDVAGTAVAQGTKRLIQEADAASAWAGAITLHHLLEAESEADRAPGAPPTAARLLEEEVSLTIAVRSVAQRLAMSAPEILARSYERQWRPSIVDRIQTLAFDGRNALRTVRGMRTSMDWGLAADSTGNSRLMAYETRQARLQRRADSLAASHRALRGQIARAALERTLAALDREREPIDYGLAIAAYAGAVGLGREAAVRVGTPRAAEADLAAEDSAPTDPETRRQRVRAIAGARAFLAAHPRSAVRGEMRFRLADLELVEARESFRERMAVFVKGGTRTLPVFDVGPALALYRAILAEDPDFPHRAAVLFNAGMILADAGDAEALRFFGQLTAAHAESPYVQEAELRSGDLDFVAERFGDAAKHYGRAAAGADPNIKTIATYKSAWANYHRGRYAEAVEAFVVVLDGQASAAGTDDGPRVDLGRETEGDLVQALARAGGAEAFARAFAPDRSRPYERRVLLALAQHQRRQGQAAEAAAADQLFLSRYPTDVDALASAERLVDAHRRARRESQAREAMLRLAPGFAPGGAWHAAQTADSARAAGARFARSAWLSVAITRRDEARRTNAPEAWREARELYRMVLSRWPDDPDRATIELNAGEASARLGTYEDALAHYGAAAGSARDSIVAQASWQRVAVLDAAYENARRAAGKPVGPDSAAMAVLRAGDELLQRFPAHANAPAVLWRQGNLAFAHGWLGRADTALARLAAEHPGDRNAPRAALLRGDALFRSERFDQARAAYELALSTARAARLDSLARSAERAIPVCAFRDAEAAVAADSSAFARHAELFERVATRWPAFDHADLAQYRAALARIAARDTAEAIRALQSLIRVFPRSGYARDAHLAIARLWEQDGERRYAAEAYAAFAERYPADSTAGGTMLHAADLFAAAGLQGRADTLRLEYVRRHAGDRSTAMEILEALAIRELDGLGEGRPISTLLGAGPRGGGPRRPTGKGPASHVAEYLRRADSQPELASPGLIARVRFLEGEELFAAYKAVELRQPLDRSIALKQKMLDQVIGGYRNCMALAVEEWVCASTYRIGESLVAFGEALERSERPAELKGEDLAGYDQVVRSQAQTFHQQGEGVWSELLRRQGQDSTGRAWVARARGSYWQRLGLRIQGRPESDLPDSAVAAAGGTEDRAGAVRNNNQGLDRMRAGDLEAAQSAFREAIRLDPRLAGPYYNLTVLEKLYRLDDATAANWFRLYRERASEDPDGIAEEMARHMSEDKTP